MSRLLGTCAAAAMLPAMVSAEEYHVVVLQALTGPAAFIGTGVADGAKLAEQQINEKGLLGAGNTLKVDYADDATDRTQTMSLIARYANDPTVLAVMGPTSGAVAIAGASSGNEYKVPLITTSNTPDVLAQGPWSYILTQPPEVTIPYISDYAADVAKVKTCAVIGIRDIEAYVSLQKEFEKLVTAKGVTITTVEQVGGTDSDFSSVATKIASADQDCVFVSASASQGANIIVQLRQAGLDPAVKVFGHNAFASPAFLERGGAAVEGVTFIGDWVPGGYDDFTKAFAADFTAKFGHEPDNWGAVGYGGMLIIANALKAAGAHPTREAVRDAIGKTKDVRVAVGQGNYSLDENRIPHVGMNVLTVKDGAFIMAPR
ncbi:MAG: ABC transporter substrate-binding protein [Paracoccaceae bacterium]